MLYFEYTMHVYYMHIRKCRGLFHYLYLYIVLIFLCNNSTNVHLDFVARQDLMLIYALLKPMIVMQMIQIDLPNFYLLLLLLVLLEKYWVEMNKLHFLDLQLNMIMIIHHL